MHISPLDHWYNNMESTWKSSWKKKKTLQILEYTASMWHQCSASKIKVHLLVPTCLSSLRILILRRNKRYHEESQSRNPFLSVAIIENISRKNNFKKHFHCGRKRACDALQA